MNKKLLTVLFLLTLSFALSAQEPAAGVADSGKLFLWTIIVGAGSMALASIFGAFAQAKSITTAIDNIGRNPSAADAIRNVLIFGLVLIESLVIYVLLINLILFFVKWGSYKVS
jgi:F-type H+-transporting ATPase subunit c